MANKITRETAEDVALYTLSKQKNSVRAIGPSKIILGLKRARIL